MPETTPIHERLDCTECGRPLAPGALFCSHCGRSRSLVASPAGKLASAGGELKSRLLWNAINRSAALFCVLLFSDFVLAIFAKFYSSLWSETIVSGLDALVVLGFAVGRRREIIALLGIPKVTWRSSVELILVTFFAFVLVSTYFALIRYIGFPILRVATEFQKAGWGVGEMFLAVSITPAIVEELAFRGVIQSSLEDVFEWREAWVIQAALFSVLHLVPIIFLSHFVLGLIFGYLRRRTKSLYPGMIAHASWNALVLLHELN